MYCFKCSKSCYTMSKPCQSTKSIDMKTDHSKKSLLDLEILFYLECSFPNKILTSSGTGGWCYIEWHFFSFMTLVRIVLEDGLIRQTLEQNSKWISTPSPTPYHYLGC